MKTKKVNRYYCDYCKKSGCSKYYMERHELGCTMNPDRRCMMCFLYGGNQVSVADLVALFPEPVIINEGMYSETIKNQCDLDDALKVVREKTSDCPACILAAIRQSKIYYNFDFNFQDETAAFWVDFNKENY